MASETIQQGATSQTIEIFIADSASSPVGMGKTGLTASTVGLKVYYQRRGSAPLQITLSALASVTAAWASGGFVEIDATNQPGRYRLDLPNAVVASGVDRATVTVTGGGSIDDEVSNIDLTTYDPFTVDKTGFSLSSGGIQAIWDALTTALVTSGSIGKLLASGIPAAAPGAAGGLPTTDANNAVKVQSGTGANQLSLAAGAVTVGTNNDKTGYTASTVTDKTGYALSATGMDPVLDSPNAIETGLSWRGALRLIMAVLAGKVTVSGGTVTFRQAVADTKARVTATASGGNRTAMTTDQT